MKIWDTKLILRFKNYQGENDKKDKLSDRMDIDEPAHELNRPVASMSRHNGAITCVKFSPDGRYLASGSDDKIVLIWEKDEEQANRPKQFGETEADLEHWVVRKRLVAHDNDVQDICWSPDGSLLITVGLDRSIIIWSGTTFERIKRYDIHQSMVKGIVFDPANKFFATASDDRTVRIFRYSRKLNDASANNYEFQVEHIVVDPFRKSPLTSYFRRMSWSPDGQHIAVPNATNGPVTAVVIVNRGNWATDVSLIGHEAPCEVCSFSPRLFRLQRAKAGQYMTVLATGGQDRTLAVWSTGRSKPLVVAEDIVENSITDICWTPDGQSLFLTSLDGSVTCVIFEENELGELVAEDVNDSQLLRYGGDRELTVFAESAQQLELEELAAKQGAAFAPLPATPKQLEQPKTEDSFTTAPSTPIKPNNVPLPAPAKINKLTQSVKITKDGKKRVAPMLISTSSAASKPNTLISQSSAKTARRFDTNNKVSQLPYFLPRLGIQTSVHGLRQLNHRTGDNELKANEDHDNDNEDIGMDDPTSMAGSAAGGSYRKRFKRYRRWLMVHKYPTPFKYVSDLPNVLFRNAAMMNHELSNLLQKKELVATQDLINPSSIDVVDENIMFQVVVKAIQHNYKSTKFDELTVKSNGSSDKLVTSIVEVRNGSSWPDDDASSGVDFAQRLDFQDPTQVIVSNNENAETRDYVLYFPFKIQQVLPILSDGRLYYYVLISFDGAIQIIHADTGSYVAPLVDLGSNVVLAKQSGPFILLLTSTGLIYTWQVGFSGRQLLKGVMKGVSIAPVLNCETLIPKIDTEAAKKGTVQSVVVEIVKSIIIDPSNGKPYVTLRNSGSVYTYCTDMMVWSQVVDPWYFLALEQTDVQLKSSTISNLLKDSYAWTQELIERGRKSRYTFGDDNAELRDVMQNRFRELVELS